MSEILTLKNINQYFFQGKNKVEVLKNLNFRISFDSIHFFLIIKGFLETNNCSNRMYI